MSNEGRLPRVQILVVAWFCGAKIPADPNVFFSA